MAQEEERCFFSDVDVALMEMTPSGLSGRLWRLELAFPPTSEEPRTRIFIQFGSETDESGPTTRANGFARAFGSGNGVRLPCGAFDPRLRRYRIAVAAETIWQVGRFAALISN